MGHITRVPLVVCDNCGKQAEKEAKGGDWKKPLVWGHVRVAPTNWDRYPNNIDLLDLCPECNKVVHAAVRLALESAKKARAE